MDGSESIFALGYDGIRPISAPPAHIETLLHSVCDFFPHWKKKKKQLLFQFDLISQIIPYRKAQKYVLINYSNLSENLLQTKQIFKLFISLDNQPLSVRLRINPI